MLVKTSTRNAPWCLVEGNDKYWGADEGIGAAGGRAVEGAQL